MSINVSAEDFFGCRLDETTKSFEWKYPEEDEGIEHKLFISQATLAAIAKDKERNVIEVEVEDDEGTRTFTIASLKIGLNETIGLNLGFTSTVTFKLASGSGPVDLVGSHLVGSDEQGDEDDEDYDEMNSELEGDSEMAGMHNGMSKKTLMGKMGKAMGMGAQMDDSDDESDEGDDDDEEDDEDEDSDEEESESPQKKDKSAKMMNGGVGKSKKMKMEKENKPQKKVSFVEENKSKGSKDLESIKKALAHNKTLPKTQEKFENFLKSNMKVTDKKVMNDAWLWYQKTKMSK